MATFAGVLGSRDLNPNINQAIYYNNDDAASSVTISVCNRGGTVAYVSIAVSTSATTPTNAEWIRFNNPVNPKGVLEKQGIVLSPGMYIVVKSTKSEVNAVAYGLRVGNVVGSVNISQNPGVAPTWVTPSPVIVYAGSAASTQLSATDSEGESVAYSIASGALPVGMSLSTTGLLSGTPSSAGYVLGISDQNNAATIAATDSRGNSTPQIFNIVKRWADGTSSALAAPNAAAIRAATGSTTSGVFWINVPTLGPTQLYCDQTTDGGGWMMLGYAGSVAGVGNNNQMMFNQIGNLASTRANDQTSFSRFDLARLFTGASANSQAMWRRTTDSNVILIHSLDEMWNRLPGGPKANDLRFDYGYPITTMKMSNTGSAGVVVKTNGRYEGGPGYPGIAWNSTYNENSDGVGSFTSFLNRRSLVYWETNGPQIQNQWFHGDPLQMGPSRSATSGTGKKDIEIYFKV